MTFRIIPHLPRAMSQNQNDNQLQLPTLYTYLKTYSNQISLYLTFDTTCLHSLTDYIHNPQFDIR